MIKKLLYYSSLLVVGLTAMDAVCIVEGFTYGRVAFFIMLFFACLNPKVLIPRKKDEYQTILLIFIFYVGLTMPFSLYADEVFNRLLFLIQYYLIVVVVGNVVVTRKEIYHMFFMYCLGCLYVGFTMFFEYKTESDQNDLILVRADSVGNPNENSFLLVYATIISYILIKNNIYSRKISFILYLLMFFNVLGVFSSGSRMGFLILIFTIFSVFLFNLKLKLKSLLYLLIGFMFLYFIIYNNINIITFERLLGSKNDIEINNFSSRENIWKNAIIMFNSNDFNWIIGNGWCTFPLWYQKYFSIYLGAHNFYISYLYTTGLIGVIILITYFINLIKVLTKHSMFYFLLILIPFFSMLTTNWEYRRWWFLMGLFIYKLSDLKKDSNLNP
jgi:hypothetical protein